MKWFKEWFKEEFRKMDEMEKHIALKSIKVAYIYTVIFLLVFIIRDRSDEYIFLLATQNLVFLFSQYYFKIKMEDD